MLFLDLTLSGRSLKRVESHWRGEGWGLCLRIASSPARRLAFPRVFARLRPKAWSPLAPEGRALSLSRLTPNEAQPPLATLWPLGFFLSATASNKAAQGITNLLRDISVNNEKALDRSWCFLEGGGGA